MDPSAPRVLVVDDDEAVRTLASWQLESDGFAVDQAGDGAEALTAIDVDRPDLVVLDLTMPGVGGLDVLRKVRTAAATETLPVIVLSGRSGETDRIVGLDLGADDYLVKPFSPGELAARVRSVLRRARPASPEPPVDSGPLALDTVAREITVDGEPVELTAREFDLLAFLVAHPRQVFSRAQLLAQVWRSEGWQGEATVTEHVHRLRQKLGLDPAARPRIRTVRGVGYQLDP
ncbi:response regulator transcription factor [Actinomycetospora endophytica]|uniref:Response regulator transcription factor n=1 Tax=Actinomycetospora endophytica TaxID=2291215 RepID=A0ABS8P2F2_9PSEU|nr:response regulator transcription factor [Actinomycetospora endophytica]MCD2192430.1 response regulator transcription factor [Actinomycetospora endophytica]